MNPVLDRSASGLTGWRPTTTRRLDDRRSRPSASASIAQCELATLDERVEQRGTSCALKAASEDQARHSRRRPSLHHRQILLGRGLANLRPRSRRGSTNAYALPTPRRALVLPGAACAVLLLVWHAEVQRRRCGSAMSPGFTDLFRSHALECAGGVRARPHRLHPGRHDFRDCCFYAPPTPPTPRGGNNDARTCSRIPRSRSPPNTRRLRPRRARRSRSGRRARRWRAAHTGCR